MVSQSWTGSTAALPTAGFGGKTNNKVRNVELNSTVLIQ